MEPPPGVGNGTWVYYVRNPEPTPYVLQLERKVEELTATVEELRGVVQTIYSVLAADGLIPINGDGEEPDSPEERAENAPESESRITDNRDEDGQEAPLLNLKQEVESEDDMEIDEDCEPNMTGGSSPDTYWCRQPVSRRSGKRVSYVNEDGRSSSSSRSPSPPSVKTAKRGRARPKKQPPSATPQAYQCITCDEIFRHAKALSIHCNSSQPRHGKQCRRGTRFLNNKSSWLKHKDGCDACNFMVRNSYFKTVVDVVPAEGERSQLTDARIRGTRRIT